MQKNITTVSMKKEKSKNPISCKSLISDLEKAIEQDNIENFKRLQRVLEADQAMLREYYEDTSTLTKNLNLIISACKYNSVKILESLFNINCKILEILSSDCQEVSISAHDKDEMGHTAFYYAIHSGNVELLETLINKWPNSYFASHSDELDEILSVTYEELKLKNVPLTDEMEIFVEHKLINLRFFSCTSEQNQCFRSELCNIAERIDLIVQNIRLLKSEYEGAKKVDTKFIFVAKFIAQNIHVLKRQLRFTYDRLPWEEMEFCLVSFISCYFKRQEINLFYQTTLSKGKMLNYLENFAKKLEAEEGTIERVYVSRLGDLPKLRREKVVSEVIKNSPEFKDLYDDYQQVRDICSLEKMNEYIQLALSIDPKEREGQLIITRVLQVIGEYLKNTLESPKLSNTTSELILLSLSKNTRNVIIDLRNSLSHVYSLSRRTEIEEKRDVNFFRGVQNDTKKVGDVITDILYNRKIAVIRMTLSKIMNGDKIDEIAEVARVLTNVEVGKMMSGDFKMMEHEKLKNLIKELSNTLTDKASCEVELFNKMSEIVNSVETKFENIKTQYSVGLHLLKVLCTMADDVIDDNMLHQLKFCVAKVIECIAPKIEASNLKEITLCVKKILKIRSDMQDNRVHQILHEIYLTAEYGLDSVHCLEDLGGKLSDNTITTMPKEQNTLCLIEEESNRQLEMKLSELKHILTANELKGDVTGKLPSYKSNKKLQAVVEMLMLDIMSILGGTKNYLENNLLFLDESVPLLTGKCLRNHLAHNNILLDVLLSDPSMAVILNAKVLTEKDIMKVKKKIGKLVRDDPSKLRDKYDQGLNVITNQEKMFAALEEGDLEKLKDCLRRGADISARGLKLSTALHFAAKGPSLETVKYILDQTPSFTVKDIHGQSPLHTAAAHGRKSVVEFFLERGHFPVDDADKMGRTPLYMAVRGGFKEIVQVLLKNGANPYVHAYGGSVLEIAIQKNHIDVVKLLLENEANINTIDTYSGCTLLYAAAEYGRFEIARFLLERGAHIDSRNDRDETPLYVAARYGHADIVTLLISSGANVNSKVLDDCTPLLFATVNGHEQVAKILLKHGANPNACDNTLFYTPLHFAAKFGHEGIAEALLNNRANFRVASVNGETPLHFAAQSGHLGIVKALLKHGASIHTAHKGNTTALNFAADSGHLEVIKFLIERGAKVNVKKHDGSTALHSAARTGNLEIAELLVKSGAKVNARDTADSTPLHAAALSGSTGVMELLIKNGADVNARMRLGVAPLPIAARNGREAAVILLVRNNADVNAKDSLGVTALHAAILEGHKSIAEFLIQNGAEINVRNSPGSTPLGVAVETGHKEIVELLIRNGADVNTRDREDMTPLLLAVNYNNKEILEILVANGARISEHDDPLTLAIQAGYREMVKILVNSDKIGVNIKGRQDVSVLHQAVKKGDAAIVRSLLAAGAEVDAVFTDNHTALHCAAGLGNEEIAEILIANGADTSIRTKTNGFTPLHYAASHGHGGVIKILLDNGVDVGIETSDGMTPLKIAVLQGHLEAVKVLLQRKKISRLPTDGSGSTILHTAADRGKLEIVKYLAGKGYDVNAKNKLGMKPIHAAAAAGHKDTVEFLLSKGVSIDEPGLQHGTPLQYAVFNRHFELTRYLIARGADINARDGLNMTALHVAATFELKNIMEELLKNGAIYNAVDKTGGTPLTAADDEEIHNLLLSTERLFQSVMMNNVQEMKKSIKDGACVNAKNLDSMTPLHCAAARGYGEIVSILLQNKANPNSIDSKRFTPLYYAINFCQVVKSLLEHGAMYNVENKDGRVPVELSKDPQVITLLKLTDELFNDTKAGDLKVIDKLKALKPDEFSATTRARDRHGNTLLQVALITKQKNIASELLKMLKAFN